MEQWSSRPGFVFAAIGAVVGLGNIWRFPALVGQNGTNEGTSPTGVSEAGDFAIYVGRVTEERTNEGTSPTGFEPATFRSGT